MELLQSPLGLLFWEVFLILMLVLFVAALVDLLKSTFGDSNTKMIWLIVILFVPVVGLILYFVIGTKQKAKL